MLGDVAEIGLKRSVWLWCLLSALLSTQTWPLAATLLAVVGILGMYSTALTKITTPPERYLREAVVLYTTTIVGGLALYGASRLLCRAWQPLVACVAFLVAQAAVLALDIATERQMSSKVLFDFVGRLQSMAAKVSNLLLVNPPSQHPLVRYPLFAMGIVLFIAGMSTVLVLSTFSVFRNEAVPPLRSKARACRLKLRSWSNGCRAILASPATQYTHRSLDNPGDTIRLLRLLPRRPFGQIRCELFEAAVSDAPDYEAVSYTWGPDDFTGLIHIQGKPLSVSSTIETLFYHLSSYAETKVLWIDQICINQADDAEKSSQVPLMGTIYSNATSTIVWLDDVEEPWKARTMLAGIWHEFVYGTEESSLAMIRQHSLTYPHSGGWSQLSNIFANPYFSRVWVVQEVVLSPSITVLASGEPLSWDHLALFASKMTSHPYSDELRAGPSVGIKDASPLGTLNALVMATLREEIRDGLNVRPAREPESLLGLLSNLRSTLPADRLYGLISLFPPERAASRPWLSPDYTKTARQLYTEAAKSLLLELRNNHNEILSFAGAGWQRNVAELPSWVPDWSSLAMVDTGRSNFTKIQNSSRFNASAGAELAIWFPKSQLQRPNDPPILSLQGHMFDTISHLGPVHSYTEHNRGLGPGNDAIVAVLQSHICSRRLAMRYTSDPYRPTNQPLQEAFWRTLVGDTVFSRPAHAELGRGCRLWERLMANTVDPAGTNVDLVDETNTEPSVDEIKAAGQMHEAFRETLLWNGTRSNCCTGRRFCVTGRGHLAMVPPGVEEGDSLAILYGLHTPFVLRTVPGEGPKRLVMVGEAYVHGVMDGEAMMEETNPEVFDLI